MAGSFLVLSDIHLNLWNYGNPRERLDQQIGALYRALEHARDANVDAVLFCGDMFHTQGQVHTLILEELFRVLRHMRFPPEKMLFVAGNHDMVFRDRDNHALCILESFGRVANSPFGAPASSGRVKFQIPNLPPILAFNYTDRIDTLKARLDAERLDGALVLLHQGVAGVEVRSKGFVLNEGLTTDMIPSSVFHAFAGHCHSFCRASPNLTIPGALMQHHFGDVGDPRGALFVKFDRDGLYMQQLPVSSVRFVDVPFDPNLHQLHEACLEHCNDFVRVVDVPMARAEEVRRLLPSDMDLRIRTVSEIESPVHVDAREAVDMATLFERFVTMNAIDGPRLEVGREILRTGDGVS